MGINFMIREFKNRVINTINQQPLPLEIKRLCLAEIMSELSVAAEKQVQEEILQEEKMQKNKKEIPEESEMEIENE